MTSPTLSESTRDFLAARLGVAWTTRMIGYRESASETLSGHWIGAFAQPAVVLNSVSGMSLAVEGGRGIARDEYGESSIVLLEDDDGRVAFVKRYAKQSYVYVGTIQGGMLAGYWVSTRLPDFGGVFCMVREEDLDLATLAAMRHKVLPTSTRRFASYLLVGALFLGLCMSPALGRWTFMGILVVVAFAVAHDGLQRARKRRLSAQVARWRAAIGEPPSRTVVGTF